MAQSFGFDGSDTEIQEPTAEQPDAIQTATALVKTLVACGVSEVVVCPGSRSAPLVYALEAARAAGWLRTHVKIDERVAGFYALGLSKGSALTRQDNPISEASPAWRTAAGFAPVAVVVTSGTAVANLHPAFLEAYHTGVPLVLVTADRPAYLRGTGANQTTWQAGIYGRTSRFNADFLTPADRDFPADSDAVCTVSRELLPEITVEAVTAAVGASGQNPGPVHLNVCFDNPLTPALPWSGKFAEKPALLPMPDGETHLETTENPAESLGKENREDGQNGRPQDGKRTVLVAGDEANPALWEWAISNRIPVLAEPTSGYFDHPNAVGPVPWILPAGQHLIEQVIVTGHPTLSRPVTALLSRTDLPIYVVTDTAEYFDLTGKYLPASTRVFRSAASTQNAADAGWLERWQEASAIGKEMAQNYFTADDVFDAEDNGLDSWQLAALTWSVYEDLEAGTSLLFLGSSNTVRAFDMAAGSLRKRGQQAPAPVIAKANRGLAGIDGNISTALGMAATSGMETRIILGDLTFLHDLGALALGELEAEVDIQIIVFNDGGGSIFNGLEHANPAFASVFERYFTTSQRMNLPALAVGLGFEYMTVESYRDFVRLLALPARGRTLVEVITRGEEVAQKRREYALRVQAELQETVFA